MPTNLPSCHGDLSKLQIRSSHSLDEILSFIPPFRAEPSISAFLIQWLRSSLLPTLLSFSLARPPLPHPSRDNLHLQFFDLAVLLIHVWIHQEGACAITHLSPFPPFSWLLPFDPSKLSSVIFWKCALSPAAWLWTLYRDPLALEQPLPCCAVLLNPPPD